MYGSRFDSGGPTEALTPAVSPCNLVGSECPLPNAVTHQTRECWVGGKSDRMKSQRETASPRNFGDSLTHWHRIGQQVSNKSKTMNNKCLSHRTFLAGGGGGWGCQDSSTHKSLSLCTITERKLFLASTSKKALFFAHFCT